jgi:hypothetical protein
LLQAGKQEPDFLTEKSQLMWRDILAAKNFIDQQIDTMTSNFQNILNMHEFEYL